MKWILGSDAAWKLGGIVLGALLLGFLWWALADLVLATFEIPFGELVERWRRRGGSWRDDGPGDTGAHVAA
jgi:hypothetical protein